MALWRTVYEGISKYLIFGINLKSSFGFLEQRPSVFTRKQYSDVLSYDTAGGKTYFTIL